LRLRTHNRFLRFSKGYFLSGIKSLSRTRWLPLALLVLTILALFHRLLLGETIFWGLPSLQFYPWREFAMSELAQGRLPLWNPYNGAGATLLANYQSALLYPPHLLYWLWSGPQMMGWLGMLHIAFAGYGIWRLTGRLGCTQLGCGIATLAYPLSSTLIARFGTLPMLDVAAWLPWLILATDTLLERVTLGRVAGLAAVTAMQLLAGHAQWTFYSFVLAGSYALWKLVTERRERTPGQIATLIIGAAAGIALGAGIAAAQLLPTVELQAQSQRAGGVDESFALNFSYAPLSLVTLFNPNFFGNPGDGSFVINGVYFETTAYIGILPVTLAILGTSRYLVLQRRKRRGLPTPELPLQNGNLIAFFALITLISFVLAFGSFTPIYPFLYRYVPTFKLFQAPARWLLLTVFSLAMLAALVVPLCKPDRRTRPRLWIGVVAAASMIIAGLIAPTILPRALPFTVQLLHGVIVMGILILITSLIFIIQPMQQYQWNRWAIGVMVFIVLNLWWANSLSNPTVPAEFYDKQSSTISGRIFWPDKTNQQLPQVAFTDYLSLKDYRVAVQWQYAYRHANLPNLNLLDRQPSFNSNEPLRPDGFERFSKLLNDTLSPILLRAAAVDKVVGENTTANNSSRVWIVPNAQSLPDADAIEKAMSDKDWNPEQTVFIEGKLDFPVGDKGTTQIVRETPLNLEISADAPQGGMLVLADTYYPGWLATVDGQAVTIYRANLNFRAVHLTPGKHTVTMSYEPQSWRNGLIFSVLALVIFVSLIGASFVLRRQNAGAT
jgi:hypothetical protein